MNNYAQMKQKLPVAAFKPLKNKLASVTSNPVAHLYNSCPVMIQFYTWLNSLTAAMFNQT